MFSKSKVVQMQFLNGKCSIYIQIYRKELFKIKLNTKKEKIGATVDVFFIIFLWNFLSSFYGSQLQAAYGHERTGYQM